MQFTRILEHNFSHDMIQIKAYYRFTNHCEPVKVWSFRLSFDTGEKLKRYNQD